jgi:hypothetical protein
MRQRAAVLTLLAAALACSGGETTPTETRPEFSGEGTCTVAPTLTPPAAVTVPANSSSTSGLWLLKNNCPGSPSGPWDFSATRTGAVATVGLTTPRYVISISGGGTAKVSVPFTTGAAGSGTIVFSATNDGLGPLTVTRTQNVTVTGSGVPFGPRDLFNASGGLRQVAPFTGTGDLVTPSTIAAMIETARANHIKLALIMTGGGSGNYTTDGKFDYAGKWVPKQKSFDTPAIKSAVDAGVGDGTIPFAVLIDEPNRMDWGGNVRHSTLDSMSRYVKSIFPRLKTGVDVTHTWDNTVEYTSVDVMTTQYAGTEKSGDVNTYRTQAVNSANNQNVALFFSLNILNGGKKPLAGTDPTARCPTSTTGGPGSTEDNVLKGCKMTGAEVQSYGDALLSASQACGLTMWTWDLPTLTPTGDFMAVNQAAFNHLAATAAAHAVKPCVKPR